MRQTFILIAFFLATLTLAAQSNYTPCYTNNMSKGNTAFSQGKYSEAKTYYATAKQCAGGNPTEAQKKIAACDAKIKAQKEAAEIQRLKSACPSTLKDYEGNTYKTVFIGRQCWMKENLRTTKYADGTSISQGYDTSRTTAYWYYPNNSASNKLTYGLLYNWKAVIHNSSSSNANPSGVQGICPTGWHVPSLSEWIQLEDYVSSQSRYICYNDKALITKALASTTGWAFSSDPCTAGNDQSNNNATGFSALPAGYSGDKRPSFGEVTVFWSSTDYDEYDYAEVRAIFYEAPEIDTGTGGKLGGFSVRCVKD